jgi:UDP-GlcNAc:undecaprenyl-phosphate/decaprenyl-phosphate GlcNAc-1-phosphate transferase
MSLYPIEFFSVKSYFLTFLFAFAAVLGTTPIVKVIALQCGQVDLPAHRKVHQFPVARIGGVAICLATALSLTGMFYWLSSGYNALTSVPDAAVKFAPYFDGSSAGTTAGITMEPSFWVVLCGSLGFFAVGLGDDLVSLSPLLRLLVQGAIASWVWLSGVRIDCNSFLAAPLTEHLFSGAVALGWLSWPLTVLWLVGVVNAVNWMDGLDGLASGIGSIIAASSFLICWHSGETTAAWISIALLGSLVGFLIFNFNPAQIFMGDGGSYFIGFVLASVAITGLAPAATPSALLLPLLVLAVPLGDMTLVIMARLRQGHSPFVADQRHFHHRLLAAGLPHRLAVLVMYALAAWVASLALLWAGVPYSSLLLLMATGLMLWAIYHIFLVWGNPTHTHPYQSNQTLLE